MLPQPALLQGPKGTPCPLHRAHLMGSVLLLQEDEVLCSPGTGQGRHLRQTTESPQLACVRVCMYAHLPMHLPVLMCGKRVGIREG